MFIVTCLCGEEFEAEDKDAGRSVRCPACGVRQVVPADAPVYAVNFEPRRRRFDGEPPPRTTASRLAVWSLVLGLFSLIGGLVLCLPLVLCFPALITGFMALRQIGRSGGRVTGRGMALGGLGSGAVALVCTTVVAVVFSILGYYGIREQSGWADSMNNLRQIQLAMVNYESTFGCLPPQANLLQPDPTKPPEPGVSWRVLILPYVEEEILYKQFNLNEPWDAPNNKPLSAQPVRVYRIPNDTAAPPDHTFYQVFYGDRNKAPHALFDKPQGSNLRQPGVRLATILDGTTNTILVAEAATSVPWAKPADLYFDPDLPPPLLGDHFSRGSQVIAVNGSVHGIPKSIHPVNLKSFITRDGGEVTNDEDW